ncbi:MAG: hypothetical protein AABZ74_06130 [Cyanobacteriota bacterium]
MEKKEETIFIKNVSVKGYLLSGIVLVTISLFMFLFLSLFLTVINLSRIFESIVLILVLIPFYSIDIFLFLLGMLLLFGKTEIVFKETETITYFYLFGFCVGGTHYANIEEIKIEIKNIDMNIAPSYSIIKESSPLQPKNKSIIEVIKILRNFSEARTSYVNHENAREVLIITIIFLINNGYLSIKKSIVSTYFFSYKIKSKSDKIEYFFFNTDKKLESYLENTLESKILEIVNKKLSNDINQVYHSYKNIIKSFFEGNSNSFPEAFISNIIRELGVKQGIFIKNDGNIYKINELYAEEINNNNEKLLVLLEEFKIDYIEIYNVINQQITDAFEAVKPSD